MSAGAALSLALLALAGAALAVAAPGLVLGWMGYSAAEQRLVTGILVTGTPARPVVYVTSSDPRGAGATGRRGEADTNSGVLSRLTGTNGVWTKVDLVRGLPRSQVDHAPNGMVLAADGSTLYMAQGGMTNKGAPSGTFGYVPEYALSAAILSIDLERIGDATYDLPTLDDDSRRGDPDENDPFGGNAGKNQARLVEGGPVQVFAPGFRNPYDLVLTDEGRLYTIQNGANAGWGDVPADEGPGGRCSNEPADGGTREDDTLHLVRQAGYYGHANPTRGNADNTFNDDRQTPVARSNAVECRSLAPVERETVGAFAASTNGMDEYTASNLDGALRGRLVVAGLDGQVRLLALTTDGQSVARTDTLAEVAAPLDVTAAGDDDLFPGTVWIARYAAAGEEDGPIVVLEPPDFEGTTWTSLPSSGPPRQEVSYVELDGDLYLAGGHTRHERFDPETGLWKDVAPLPASLDHIQGASVGGRIYYIGGLASWPGPHASSVYVYDPASDSFSTGAPMPRGRGAGGVAVHEGKIYYAGGLHDGAAVPWFDVYDPEADSWSRLPDMPHARDHFQAAVVDGRLYAIGGRDRDIGAEIVANDAFDFASGKWVSGLAPLPTPRGGFAAAVVDDEIVVLGGEVSERALATVEAYDPTRDSWRALEPMPTARHGVQAAVCGGEVYVAAGGLTPGGNDPSDLHEVLSFGPPGCGPGDPGGPTEGASGLPFAASTLQRTSSSFPTSLQFGSDGRLYVAQQDGFVKAYTVVRKGPARYAVTDTETIGLVRTIPNHDDDGSSATDLRSLVRVVRLALGL